MKDSTGWDHLLHKKSRDPRRHPTGLFKLFPGKLDNDDDFYDGDDDDGSGLSFYGQFDQTFFRKVS